MTMLDRMRRHRGWLKWSLAIVVVSFVLLYIPSFMNDPTQGAANNAVVADVDGREITAAQFRRVYQQQMQQYRQSYGANVDERTTSSVVHAIDNGSEVAGSPNRGLIYKIESLTADDWYADASTGLLSRKHGVRGAIKPPRPPQGEQLNPIHERRSSHPAKQIGKFLRRDLDFGSVTPE